MEHWYCVDARAAAAATFRRLHGADPEKLLPTIGLELHLSKWGARVNRGDAEDVAIAAVAKDIRIEHMCQDGMAVGTPLGALAFANTNL